MPLDAGTRLGPYRIAGPLGKGGMGEVYRADDDRLGRAVAIKVLPAELSGDPQRRRRFEREARAIAALNHPNICALHDIGQHGDIDYLVMELLEGESLAARLTRGALSFADASRLGLSVVETLGAVHERGLVHRDLKPANIFLTPHGIKLLDFGLAREVQATNGVDTGVTQQGIVMGTPRYLAPEQLRGEPVDHRADLFAAAAVIYEMLTGRPVFDAPALVDILHAITHEEPPPLAPGLAPPHFERALRQALAKRPVERPDNARAFAVALRHSSDSATVPVAVPPRQEPSGLTRLIVLPFRMLRADPDTDFLAFSLPDAVSAALAGLEAVVVRATLSAGAQAGPPDLAMLARQAQVDAAVTGTLLRAGHQLRVAAQLIAVPDGSLLWSHTIQAPVHDLFQLQDALTQAVVSALHVPLSAHDRRALQQDVPANGAAYELFLRANKLASDSTHWLEVRDLYEQAVELDPGYAPAWARLGRVLRVLAKYGGRAAHDDRARAERAFERALALNPDLAAAHYFYAHLEAESGRAEAAMVRLLGRARSRRTDPELLAGLVTTCRYCGLIDESIAAYELANRLDPGTPTSVCYAYYMRGDYPLTIATDLASMPFAATLARFRLGELEQALPAIRRLEQESPHQGVRIISATYRHAMAGDTAALMPVLEQMYESGFADPEGYFLLAAFVSQAGAAAAALAALERAVTGGYHCPWSLDHDPYWDRVRDTSEFARLRQIAEEGSARSRSAFGRAGGTQLLAGA